VLLCSGKIYWELVAERERRKDTRTAIVRLEQLYPLDVEAIRDAIAPTRAPSSSGTQDEPANQGAWPFIALTLPESLDGRPLVRLSRPASASPAAGSSKKHQNEQAALLAQAFTR
jgi:2-oxoglutarate dehydrogenase E1 component